MSGGNNAFDDAVRNWTLAHQTPVLHGAFAWVSKIGSVSPMCWLAVVLAVFLFVRGRRRAAASVSVAPMLAVGVYLGGKRFLPRARPPGVASLAEPTSSFPSAHATTSAAICCTIAYIFWREGILPPVAAITLAIVPPLLIGTSRVYLDVHWATDVLGGWVAGLLIVAVARTVYRHSSALT